MGRGAGSRGHLGLDWGDELADVVGLLPFHLFPDPGTGTDPDTDTDPDTVHGRVGGPQLRLEVMAEVEDGGCGVEWSGLTWW